MADQRKTWLITGTSRGIGLELTRQLLALPFNTVIATCRNPYGAKDLHALKLDAKGTLYVVQLDVSDEDSIRKSADVVRGLLGDQGVIDYLINNAGVNTGDDLAFNFKTSDLMECIRDNVAGPAVIAQTYLPFLERSERPVIMNMTSGLASIGLNAGLKCAAYSISKTALNMLTYKQSVEKQDFIVVTVDPGWVKTKMGGEGAMLEIPQAVTPMVEFITSLHLKNSGKFYNSYTGKEIPW